MEETPWKTYFIFMYIGHLITRGIIGCSPYINKQTPLKENVQLEYARPSNIETRLEDIDEDGKDETIFGYKGKNYLVLDKNGELKVTRYEIIPKKIISPKITYSIEK